MRGWGLFFFLLFLLLILAIAGWIIFTQTRARRAGLPPPTWRSYIPFLASSEPRSSNYPSPRASGPLDWLKDQIAKLRSGRTKQGGYEENAEGSGSGAGAGVYGRLGRGRDREDDAWDTHVGEDEPEGYGHASTALGGGTGYGYDEQELGIAPTPGDRTLQSEPYQGTTTAGGNGGDYLSTGEGQVRGHSRGRSDGGDPFGDRYEQQEGGSMRSVSPRPDTSASHGSGGGYGHGKGQSLGSLQADDGGNTSPISTRKSVFREGI